MIKIIFEINEESISKEHVQKKLQEKTGNCNAGALLAEMIGYMLLRKQIEKGKKEFVITQEKLDSKSKELYETTIGTICSLASFSETDEP